MQQLSDTDLLRLSPQWALDDQEARALIEAVNELHADLQKHLDDPLLYARFNQLSSAALDHLAAQWHAEVWRDVWPVSVKRDTLKSLIIEKPRLGTLSAVKNAISAYGGAVSIQEWWEQSPPGTPHTFIVYIRQNDIEGLSPDDVLSDLKRLIDSTKPTRSQYRFILSWDGSARLPIRSESRSLVSFRYTMPERPRAYGVGSCTVLSMAQNAMVWRYTEPDTPPGTMAASVSMPVVATAQNVACMRLVQTAPAAINGRATMGLKTDSRISGVFRFTCQDMPPHTMRARASINLKPRYQGGSILRITSGGKDGSDQS